MRFAKVVVPVAGSGCAGSDTRNLTAFDVVCPKCGASIEFFSDEGRRKCHVCGTEVTRDVVPACAAHCASALSCLGPERYKQLLESGAIEPQGDDSEKR